MTVSITVTPRFATTLQVQPVVLGLWPFRVALGTVSARLTSRGVPVAGQTVTFTADGQPVCTGTTGSDGVAGSASSFTGWLRILLTGGVSANYNGNNQYLGTDGRSGLIG